MHIYIYIYTHTHTQRERERERVQNYITNAPTCFGASSPSSGSFDIAFAKVILSSKSLYGKICNVCRIVVVAAYANPDSCFGVSGVLVGGSSLSTSTPVPSQIPLSPVEAAL